MKKSTWTLVACAAVLSGCANPMLRIDAPGFSGAKSTAPAQEPQSMAEAMAKLNHVRAAYYEAIVQQTGQSQDATTGLVWLGTLIAGMAAGSVHKDAVLGASLIGGTTYGLSRSQLDARRILVWTEGMKALDCAKEAALPLDLGADRQQRIKDAAATLSQARGRVQAARAGVQAEIDQLGAVPLETRAPAQEAVLKADAALAEADKTQAAALALLQAARGGALSVTVDRVHTRVTEAMRDLAVDVGSVKQMVAGLGGFAAVFAPGAGIDGTLAGAFGKFGAAKSGAGAQSAAGNALIEAMSALEREMKSLAVAQSGVAALLGEVSLTAVSAALGRCDVKGVALPIALQPAGLSFEEKSSATKGFAISGGTPPYVVTMLDAAPEGLSLQFSGGFADTAQVKVANVAKGEYRIRVADSGTAKHAQQLVVQVGATPTSSPIAPAVAAPASPVAIGTPAGGSTVKADWEALRAAMTKSTFKGELKGVTFSVTSATPQDGGLAIKLNCSKVDAGLPAAEVREQLSLADKAATNRLIDAKALDGDMRQLDLVPSRPCVK